MLLGISGIFISACESDFCLADELLVKLRADLREAKELTMEFEFQRARDMTERIRNATLVRCTDREFSKLYLMTHVIDGLILYLEGKTKEAEDKLADVLSVSPVLVEEIENDRTIPQKIKELVRKIRVNDRIHSVEILSGGRVFINGEDYCKTPCSVRLRQGLYVFCTSRLCVEKLVAGDEKVILPEDSEDRRISWFRKHHLWGAVILSSGLIIVTAVLVFSSKGEKTSLKITLYE